MKLKHVKNGRICEVIQESDKFGTVYVQFEDGTDKTYSKSTIRRWWRPIEEETLQTEDDTISSDGTPYTEVMKEIVEQAKEKASATEAEPKSQLQLAMEELQDIILKWAEDNMDEVFISSGNPYLKALKTGGHMYLRFTVSNKLVSISIPEKVVENLGVEPDRHINHLYGCVYRFDSVDNKKGKELIPTLLKYAREYRVTKNLETKKEEK